GSVIRILSCDSNIPDTLLCQRIKSKLRQYSCADNKETHAVNILQSVIEQFNTRLNNRDAEFIDPGFRSYDFTRLKRAPKGVIQRHANPSSRTCPLTPCVEL